MVYSLLKVITRRFSVDETTGSLDQFEELGSGDISEGLLRLASSASGSRAQGDLLLESLAIQALYSWVQSWKKGEESALKGGVVELLCGKLEQVFSLPRAGMLDLQIASAAVKILLHYLKNNNLAPSVFESMEKCDGTGMILRSFEKDVGEHMEPRLVCMRLHLLKNLTEASPRMLQYTVNMGGANILANLLKNYHNPDVIKFVALTLSRWAAFPGLAESLISSRVCEELWLILQKKDRYESLVYAYVISSICLIHIESIDVICNTLMGSSEILMGFCRAVEQFDKSFQKPGIVQYIIKEILNSEYAFDVVLNVAKHGGLESFAICSTNCQMILETLHANMAALDKVNEDHVQISLAIFLVRKMALFPDLAVELLFSGRLANALVSRSLDHITCNEFEQADDSGESKQTDDGILTEFSWDSQSGSLDCIPNASSQKLEQNPTVDDDRRGQQQLGDLCFTTFAGRDKALGSTIILCKLLLKLQKRKMAITSRKRTANQIETSGKRVKQHGSSYHVPQNESIVTVQIGTESFQINKFVLMEQCHVFQSFLEDIDGDDVVSLPALHHMAEHSMAVAFGLIIDWCQTGSIQASVSMETLRDCWILADYLHMPRFETYMTSVLDTCVTSTRLQEDRSNMYAWLTSLHTMFPGSRSLEMLIATCIINELGCCERMELAHNIDKSLILSLQQSTLSDRVSDLLARSFLPEPVDECIKN
jgi:hypothetical protein